VNRRARRRALLAAVPVIAAAGVTTGLALDGAPDRAASALERTAATTSWKGFGVDRWPDASWRPYSARSPFNQPIPAGTRTAGGSEAMIRQILSWSRPAPLTAGVAGTPYDWGHPTYYAKPGDPLYTLRPTARWGANPLAGLRIPIPAAARAAGGGDAHMTLVTPDGWEYDFWRVQAKPSGGGTLRFAWGGRVRIDGDGLDGGGTASRFGNLAGMIRAPELAAGRIDHALFLTTRCTSSDTTFGHGVRRRSADSAYVYPAVSGGSSCAHGTAVPPMGARLQLTMTDAQIAALGAPAWKTAILVALAHYGGFIGDTGGDGISLMFESSTMYTAFGRPDPLAALARSAGIAGTGGRYTFDVAGGVDWQRYLRVVVPPKR
jgi:hypothetical protein